MAEQSILYDATVRVLTPLHIGSGNELLHQYDYVAHAHKTWRINEVALLDAQDVDDAQMAERLARIPPGQLLSHDDFETGAEWFRYVIDGVPRSQSEGAQLREQIKDAYDRVYLPGSSLKGALRTSLGWYLWGQSKYEPAPEILGKSDKWAARDIEKELFGQTQNLDWMRALQVSDSQPLSSSTLAVENASVLKGNGGVGAPIELETVKTGTLFQTSIKVDRVLFSEWANLRGFDARQLGLLTHIPEVVQRHSKTQLNRLYRRAQAMDQQSLAARYRMLVEATLTERQCLLQLGWGTGWMSKTFGIRLLKNEALRNRIFTQYRLNPQRKLRADADFPSSQRVVVDVQTERSGRSVTTPRAPFGWVLLELQERR